MAIEMKTVPRVKYRVRCDQGTMVRPALVGGREVRVPCMKRGPWRKQKWRAKLDAEKRGFLEVARGVMVCPEHR